MADENIADMREAIVIIRDMLINGGHDAQCRAKIVTICNAVLSTPPRNCDVGTAEEQSKRFSRFCESHPYKDGVGCRCANCELDAENCEIAWAQMPYKAEGVDK